MISDEPYRTFLVFLLILLSKQNTTWTVSLVNTTLKTQQIGSALEVSSFEQTIGTYNVQKGQTCSEKSEKDNIT